MTTTQDTKGQYLSINLGFALGVTFGVFVSRGVSGKGQYENEWGGEGGPYVSLFKNASPPRGY